jgi:hypothetical protein
MSKSRIGAPTGIPRASQEDMVAGSAVNYVFDARRQRDVVKMLRPQRELAPINDVAAPSTETRVKKW